MSIEWVKGDLLEADVDYICHQVNCQGKMGSGIAKSIRDKWPNVYTKYISDMNYHKSFGGNSLGSCQFVEVSPELTVINMFAQEYYGYDGRRYTSYDAFWSCLGEIKNILKKGSKIGFPRGIGCGLGGANWEVIESMIIAALDKDFEVYIYWKGN